MALTDAKCRAAQPGAKLQKLTDGGGLQLWVQPSGARLWRLAYRFGGKQKLPALGVYPTISLARARQAREDAKRLLANGADPTSEKSHASMALTVSRMQVKSRPWIVFSTSRSCSSASPRVPSLGFDPNSLGSEVLQGRGETPPARRRGSTGLSQGFCRYDASRDGDRDRVRQVYAAQFVARRIQIGLYAGER
jgi:hypothetical protein